MKRFLFIALLVGFGCEDSPNRDCAGVEGGSAIENDCGNCVGGDTGLDENYCSVTDIDGNIYGGVFIGEQIWMSENLKVTHYKNSHEILTGYSKSEWNSLVWEETGASSF